MQIGLLEKLPPPIYIKTIATAPSPTSPINPDWPAPAGRRASALATTTTTDGTIFAVASGVTTFFSTIMATAHLRTSPTKPASTTIKSAGAQAVRGSTTIVTAFSIYLSATT